MNSKVAPQVFEDFEPTSNLVQGQDADTLVLNLPPGFKKADFKVRATTSGILKITGQRPVGENKWIRFQKDFPISVNTDTDKVSAKFENDIVSVKIPKLIASADTQQPKKPTDQEQPQAEPQKKGEENAKTDEKTTTPPTEELPNQESKNPNPENDKQTTEAKAEKTDGSKTSNDSKLENDDAKMGTATVLVNQLKMPRKVMNMTLLAILVLGIGLYVSTMMNSNNHQAEE